MGILQIESLAFEDAKERFDAPALGVVPETIILLFQPPYCPELNPIERLWEHLKADLK